MSPAWLVIGLIGVLWALGVAIIYIIDSREERRYRYMLQTRDWDEKVQAMRRLQDREGDA
jgi:hypothetical protein